MVGKLRSTGIFAQPGRVKLLDRDHATDYLAGMSPRWLYLHGFASGPDSTKGTTLAVHFATLGVDLHRMNLRVPSMAHLRLSAMIDTVQAAIGGPEDRAILFGSSLGGLVAARVAERDPRVVALVLLAPAFRMAQRWRARRPVEVRDWERTGWLRVDDHAIGDTVDIDWGFFADAEATDRANDGWPDVRVPTVIIHGSGDDVVDIDHSRTYAWSRPHVRLVEVEDGHELRDSLGVIAAEAQALLTPWMPGPDEAPTRIDP